MKNETHKRQYVTPILFMMENKNAKIGKNKDKGRSIGYFEIGKSNGCGVTAPNEKWKNKID